VDNRDRYETYSAATIAALNGAIKADGLNVSKLAKRIGVDYNTLRRYLRSEREMPMIVLYAIVDQLTIDEAELFTQAQKRFDRR
jgi:transcriptional regulator with XRE-family HTH domain